MPLTPFYKSASRHLHTDRGPSTPPPPRGGVSGLMHSPVIQVSAAASLPSGEIPGRGLKRMVTHIGGSDCLEARGMAGAGAPLSGGGQPGPT